MTSAEIITIGTELLLGDITDINTPYLSKELNKLGIDVFRTVTVGDNPARISRQIRQSLENANIVILTGGLGPTIDDPTRQAVADAFGVTLQFSTELWAQIKKRFERFHHSPTENNRKQAYLPAGAIAIENTVGTAPAFYVLNKDRFLVSLPGVPAEAKYIFQDGVIPLIQDLFSPKSTTFTRVIRTAGMGESSVDALIGEFEKYANPTVGITAHPGQVDIRITAKAADTATAVTMIKPVEEEILRILGDHVFGFDGDTLQDIVTIDLRRKGFQLTLKYSASFEGLIDAAEIGGLFKSVEKVEHAALVNLVTQRSLYNKATPKVISVLIEGDPGEKQQCKITVIQGEHILSKDFFFGGHESLFPQWVKNQMLNLIRTYLQIKVNEWQKK